MPDDARPNPAPIQLTVSRRSVRQGLAWMVAAEFVRRHPDRARVAESHSHQTDALAVFIDRGVELDVYSGGWEIAAYLDLAEGDSTISQRGWQSGPSIGPYSWLQLLLSEDIRSDFVEPLERSSSLRSPAKSPPTVQRSIGVRVLAAFAQKAMFAPPRWHVMSGYADGDDGGEAREHLFAQVTAARAHRDEIGADRFGPAEYRYWFVCEGLDPYGDSKPHVAVDTVHGLAFANGQTIDLRAAYVQAGRSVDRLVSDCCPPTY